MRALVEDSRQKPGQHEGKNLYWQGEGVAVVRCKLPYGDYALVPSAAVDTKKDIQELASDVFQQHDRFRREYEGARDAGCLLVILVENRDGVRSLADLAGWVEPEWSLARRSRNGAKAPLSGERLAKACATMRDRYGTGFAFCTPEESGAVVLDILRRIEERRGGEEK